MGPLGEALVGEEGPREQPHRQLDEVDPAVRRLGGGGARADEEPERGEGRRTQRGEDEDGRDAAAHLDVEDEPAENEQEFPQYRDRQEAGRGNRSRRHPLRRRLWRRDAGDRIEVHRVHRTRWK